MSAVEPVTVTVRLLDREFLIGCAPEERSGLQAAAQLLDAKMREMKHSTRSPGYDRIAVLAALSLAHELLQLRQRHAEQSHALGDGIVMLRRKLEGVLAATLE